MVEEAKRDPTVQEIVVALRETTFGSKGRGSAATARRSEPDERASEQRWAIRDDIGERASVATAPRQSAALTAAGLRDAETRRLLDENARLNERVIELLKLLEQEQEARTAIEAEVLRAAAERASIASEVRGAVEAQVKPVLLTVLELLQHLQSGAAAPRLAVETETAAWRRSIAYRSVEPGFVEALRSREATLKVDRVPPETERSAPANTTAGTPTSGATAMEARAGGYYPGWIPDLMRTVGGEAGQPPVAESGNDKAEPQRPSRGGQLIARLFGRASAR
jgi:hypothetical protein